MNGKLIVIEGSDGSGKTTQLNLLKKYFEVKQYPFRTYKFPNYESFFGRMIASWLRGEYGDLTQTNPYLISVLYAEDRALMRDTFSEWIKNGETILLDRYATSNQAHQCGRLPQSEREKFLAWDVELEYDLNKIPREDIVIYLHIPYQTSIKLIEEREVKGREYAHGKIKDMVEADESYLKNAEDTYYWLSNKYDHWVTVECVDSEGNLRTREDIHEEIKKILKEKSLV